MNKLLRTIGWKDYRGRWDRKEIKIDAAVLLLSIIILNVVYIYILTR